MNFISSFFEGLNIWAKTNSYYENIGGGTLNLIINKNPVISLLYSFGNMVVETEKFKEEQAFYYKKQMQEFRNSNGQKFREAEALYNRYNPQSETDNEPVMIKQAVR